MVSKQFAPFLVCFLISICKIEKTVSSFYPDNTGHWYGDSCIKFDGAIRILVPVLLPSGISQTFPLDIPPEAFAEGRCLYNNLFSIFTNFEVVNSIFFQWQTPILDTNEMAINEFSIDFKYSVDEFGNSVYSISKFYVSYYNAQFVHGVNPKKIEQQAGNLDLFPVSTFNSFKCGHGELKATTDLFHIYFYDAQWQAFSEIGYNEEFKAPFTSSDCFSDENEDTEVIAFWKVWLVSTIIVLIVCVTILGLLIAVRHCVRKCYAQQDEGYETFA